jgi:outer membrane lipoprotein carrier protein
MKHTFIAATCAGVLVTAMLCPAVLLGQPTPEAPSAQQVVARMQQFYNTTTDYQADFFQTYFNRLFNNYQRSRGKVYFKKPGRMRWEYAPPERKLFVSDGRTMWAFEPEANQAFQQSLRDSQLPTALSFLTGQGDLATEFNFRLIPAQSYGFTGGHVVELRPKTANAQYERLVFFVDGTSYQVRRSLVIDQAGNRNKMEFANARQNQGIQDSRFSFTPPQGVRIIRP